MNKEISVKDVAQNMLNQQALELISERIMERFYQSKVIEKPEVYEQALVAIKKSTKQKEEMIAFLKEIAKKGLDSSEIIKD